MAEAAPPVKVDDKYKEKALDLAIDSLKLYITLSTFSFGGLSAIFAANNHPSYTGWFYASLIAFFASAIVSVYTINAFIGQVVKGKMDAMETGLRGLNFAAIGLFGVGFLFGTFFILLQNLDKPKSQQESSKVYFEKGVLKVTGNLASSVRIVTDSVTKTKTFVVEIK